jgi:aryl sulfotransferase
MTSAPLPERTQTYRNYLVDSSRWDGFRPRAGDIVLSTPMKAGTTWTQMICALLIFQKTRFDRPLTAISPWLEFSRVPLAEVLGTLEAQTHRRFVKSHLPLDGLPYFEHVTYLCVGRDPRDVFLSVEGHLDNIDFGAVTAHAADQGAQMPDLAPPLPPPQLAATPEQRAERFHAWISDSGLPWQPGARPGASAILHHCASFWRFRHLPNLHFVHYADLQRDLAGEMRRIAGWLGIHVREQLWPDLLEAARFESMKKRADELVPNVDLGIWKSNERFFRSGSSGQWSSVLGEPQLALYRAALSRLPPDLARWLENGRAVSP